MKRFKIYVFIFELFFSYLEFDTINLVEVYRITLSSN